MSTVSYSTSVPCRLIRFQDDRGHPYHGLIFEPEDFGNCKTIVVHSHGTLGNFYFNKFIDAFAASYTSRGIGFMTFNHLAHDAIAESVVDGIVQYVGGSLSDFNSCIADFTLVETTLREMGFQSIVLQGHSLGCERVVHYLRNTKANNRAILLAPVNSRATQVAWCNKRLKMTLDEQIEYLREYGSSALRYDLYGSPSRNPEWDYSIPISERAILSFISSEAISYFDDIKSEIDIFDDTLAVLPSEDAFTEFSGNKLVDFFRLRIGKNSRISIVDCNHDFDGCLDDVCKQCADWVAVGIFE